MLKFINKVFQIFIDFLVFIITILILFSLYNLITIKVLNKPYTNLFGFSIFEIATGSMEPTLNVKDLVIVKITKNISLEDIITYEEDGNLITHRVIDIKEDTITTKGDANNSIDVKVPKTKIVGKIVYVIRKGGILREVFITPKVIISITITLVLISLCFSYKEKKPDKTKNKKNTNIPPKSKKNKNKEKKKNNELNNKSFQNIKDEILNQENSKE